MGRGKIEIKRIENKTNRQVTYSKRRTGLVKKASEISVLCDAKVSLVIFANNGQMHAYHSPDSSVEDILESYQNISKKRLWDAKHEDLSNEIDRVKKENDNLQIELRHLKGEDIAALSLDDLRRLEDTVDIGFQSVRDKEMEIYARYEKKIMRLEEERKELTYIWHHSQTQHKQEIMDGDVKGIDAGVCFYSQERDCYYQTHPPFDFRVQSQQPNLQNRM